MGLTELERATVAEMEYSIHGWIGLASQAEKLEAVVWYRKAHDIAVDLSDLFDITIDQASAVIAVLSPGCDWLQNVADAYAVCAAWSEHRPLPKVGTYGRQLNKAYLILMQCKDAGQTTIEATIGKEDARKTKSFYRNIRDPKTSQDVTLDRWILRALGIPVNRTSKQLYKLGTIAFQNIARQYNCQPHKVQALVWVCIRNRGGAPQAALPGF